MTYPSASTPDPSVHQAPSSSLAQNPFSPAEIEAYGEAFLDGFLAQVALALGNVSILGVKPFAFLTAWGQDLQQQAEQALGIATGAQSTATSAQSTAVAAQSTATSAQSQSSANFNLLSWILGLFGLGGSTSSTTTTTPNTPPGFTLAQFLGLLGTNTPIPVGTMAALAPSASKNVLSDPGFDTDIGIQGQGQWVWDGWVGTGGFSGPMGSVRTVRQGLITIYNIVGTSQGVYMFGGEPATTGGSGQVMAYLQNPDYEFLVDWALTGTNQQYFEWINLYYAAAEYPMGESVATGAQRLMDMINQIPGPFVFVMDSQGNQVGGAVYDELRFGSMQHRREDFVLAIACGNLRREEGHTFPGYPDPAPGTSGMCPVSLMTTGPYAGSGDPSNPKIGNLIDTEDLWWDFVVPGDYFAATPINGSTVDPGPNAVGGNVGDIAGIPGLSLRQFYAFINQAYNGGNNIISDAISWALEYGLGGDLAILEDYMGSVYAQIGNLGGISSPHNSYFTAKPFAHKGDNRSFTQIACDRINQLPSELEARGVWHPPDQQMPREMQSPRVAAQAGDVIKAGADINWINVVCEGPAFAVAVNAYDAGPNDANANLIATVMYEGCVISSPEPTSNWNFQTVLADFVMPAGTQSIAHVCYVYPAALVTGIVWFDNRVLKVTSLVDGALLDVTTLDQLTNQQIQGPQGIADMATFIQNQLDSWASANTQSQLNGTTLEQTLQSQAALAAKALLGYNLGVANNQILSNVSAQPLSNGMQPSGQVTFALPMGTLPFTTLSAGTSMFGFINSNQNVTIGFVEFEAKATSATGVYLNVYSVDTTTGTLTNIYSSADISSQIGSSWGWVAVDIPTASQFYVEIGEMVAFEIVAQGSAISVVTQTWQHASSASWPLPNQGATRTTSSTGGISPATLTGSALGWGGTAPFVCMAVSDIPPLYEPPNQQEFKAEGPANYPIPAWAQVSGTQFDIVPVGGGGAGGDADGNAFSFFGLNFGTVNLGQGGMGGKWNPATLTYGTDIPAGTTSLQVFVGSGGCAPSGNGGDTLIGYGFTHAPQFDAVGAGNSTYGTTLSWTHTATAGSYVVVGIDISFGTFDVKYGTTTMTPLGLVYNGGTGAGNATALFGLNNAPAGATTVTVTTAQTANITGNSLSFTNVSCAGVVSNIYGSGTALSQQVNCGTNQAIVHAFGVLGYASLDSFTGGTHRYYGYNPSFGYHSAGLSLSYATASTTFGATASVADAWGGIAVLLNPAGTVVLRAAGGAAGGPGGASNYNPANTNQTSTGLGPGNTVWGGHPFIGGADTITTHLAGNPPGGGSAGGDQGYPTPQNGGNGYLAITARQSGTTTSGVGGGFSGGGSEVSVVYEATGTGGENSSNNNLTWSHTTSGGPNCAVVLLGAVDYSSGAASLSATFGSSSFTNNLGGTNYYNASGAALYVFALGIIGPPSGTQTVTLSATGATINDLAGVTISYQNVGSFGNWFANTGDNTTPNLDSLAAASGEVVVCGFASISQLLTSFSQTPRWSQNVTASIPMSVGDAVGAPSVSFGASMASTDYWGAVGGLLLPSS